MSGSLGQIVSEGVGSVGEKFMKQIEDIFNCVDILVHQQVSKLYAPFIILYAPWDENIMY